MVVAKEFTLESLNWQCVTLDLYAFEYILANIMTFVLWSTFAIFFDGFMYLAPVLAVEHPHLIIQTVGSLFSQLLAWQLVKPNVPRTPNAKQLST